MLFSLNFYTRITPPKKLELGAYINRTNEVAGSISPGCAGTCGDFQPIDRHIFG